MKKIPTLFEREYENHKVVGITDTLTNPAFQDILDRPARYRWTVKFDGTCCCVMNGIVYKRYDAKRGKKAPEGAIPCCDPDPVTGHHPHWVVVHDGDPGDKYIVEAFKNSATSFEVNDAGIIRVDLEDFTYEAVGPRIQGNPYGMAPNSKHVAIKHGEETFLNFPDAWGTNFEDIKYFLRHRAIEGFVIWNLLKTEPICKIKRSDFGFEWPIPHIMEGRLMVNGFLD